MPLRLRLAVASAARMYAGIGAQLRARDCDPLQGRVYVPAHQKGGSCIHGMVSTCGPTGAGRTGGGMSQPDVDIAILGGGCAGLSVAVRLAARGRSLHVIEPRETYFEDRAWSFWRTAHDPFEDCVRRSWAAWDVDGPGGTVHRDHATCDINRSVPARFTTAHNR